MPAPRFVSALRRVLDQPAGDDPAPLAWALVDGKHCVHAREEFDPSLHLPCTSARSFGTFVRQMHNHNFRSVGKHMWHNAAFLPGCPWLDASIKTRRRATRRTASRACCPAAA